MSEIISWLGSNWTTVVGVSGTVVMSASIAVRAIAPHTKTTKDDKAAAVLGKIYTFLNKLAINTPPK